MTESTVHHHDHAGNGADHVTPKPWVARPLPEALQPLTALPNWCCWKWAQKNGKWTKPPYQPSGEFAKSNDSATWDTYDKVTDAFDGVTFHGIGWFFDENVIIAAFDVDDCRNPENGLLDPWADDLVRRCGTYAEATISGTGIRIIGTSTVRSKIHIKRKVGDNGVSCEIYRHLLGRYIVVTGDQIEGTPNHLADIDAVMDQVVTELGGLNGSGRETDAGARTNSATAGSFTIERIAEDDPRLANLSADWIELGTKGTGPRSVASMAKKPEKPGGDRSHAVFAFVCECVRQGIDDNVIASILMYWKIGEHVRDQSNVERALGRALRRAHEKVKDSKLFAMNELHCVLPINGKTRVATWADDPEFPGYRTIAMFSSLADFKALMDKYRHNYQQLDATGQVETKSVKLGSWWVSNTGRRQYDGGKKFVPTCDEDVVRGKTLNLWQGFKVAARKPEGKSGAKGCQLFLDHAHKIICSGDADHYNYLINREAFIAQRRVRSEIAVALKTEAEGTGKGLYSRTLNYLYGVHAMHIQNPDHVVGKFNPHLELLLRLTADEALFALNPLHRNALYNLITEPLTIEPKFIGAYTADNYLNIDIISNSEHFVPISGSSRRFFIPTVSQERVGDFPYFEAILKQLHDGGYEALMYHLLHEVDIKDFNVRDVPKTAQLREQAAYSRKGVDLLVEIACNRAMAPCQKENDPGFSNSSGYNKREGFDYFIDHHGDYQLKSLGSLKVKWSLKKKWGCLTGAAARTQRSGQRANGIRWPELADLRARFTAKYGPQEWMTDETEWIKDDEF